MAAANTIPRACFAPPLTDELLERYAALGKTLRDGSLEGLPDTIVVAGKRESVTPEQWAAHRRRLADAYDSLLVCVRTWWDAPESKRKDGERWKLRHKGKEITVQETPLTPELVDQLWDTTPYMDELDLLSTPRDDGILDGLEGDLRNAAFHLLWFAKEITLDREPVCADQL
jgi:hypothetical protein